MPRALAARMTPQASPVVQWAIPGLAVLVVALVAIAARAYGDQRQARRFALAAASWLGLTGWLGLSGVFADFDARPPRLLLLLVPTLGLPFVLAFSRLGGALSQAPITLLVGFQAFRLPLELVMHRAAVEGTMPPQMTYTGSNFDIISGSAALLVAVAAATVGAPRWLLLAWNALGSTLLVVILVVAVLSLPVFQAFGSTPDRINTWIAYFPYVWLPAGLVSAALLGHLLLWRRLLSRGMRGRDLAPVS